ncbi:YbjN domain-containing protein [Novosphingobium cyanobacteriorum]|uniref:YbjN domain-containing protein n=1 Tax=Novosphingobium cyanobacteriorum TaxID=3024215 RepID=A0ABT6CHH4_9SPHN|nr:YbjN domain-containing protein [Novosphingobium cyanobacteriorum]MDF8333371.1 YbjN domain-containing protein [Novosphingobium cyanobacteriorum]
MNFTRILAPTALACALVAQPALAKAYPDGGVTGEEVAADLIAAGNTATVSKDSGGDPLIKTAFKFGTAEVNYYILFYGCKTGRCSSLQFVVSFDGDTSKVAEYNANKRFARAANPEGKTIRVTYDVDVERGANSEAIANCATRFSAIILDAVKTLG